MTAPGRPVWLELNAQRVTLAASFYRELFAWDYQPLSVPPWGSIPLISNLGRTFGNQFMAMGAFATPNWNIWFSGDLEAALERIPALGGTCNPEIVKLGMHSEEVHGASPQGTPCNLIRVLDQEVPDQDAPYEPCTAEFWGPDARAAAPFYAGVLGLRVEETDRGATLFDQDTPRLFLNQTQFAIQPPRWIPYFHTTSVGGDLERARRAGAVVQVHPETVTGLGELVVLADPANAYFGLVTPATP